MAEGKLRFGILSTARIGINHTIPGMQAADNIEVAAIASRAAAAAERVAAQLGIPHAFDGYEAMLAADVVDAVYIPLPNHLHHEWTIKSARAGKHVLCEKPLALTAADAQEMVDVCAGEGVAFMEAFMYRLHPSWLEVRRLVEAGAIGDVLSISCVFSYFNDDPDNIRNIAEYGGGALMDIGCYPINVSRMILGSEPTRVSASMRKHAEFGTDIVTSALLEFGDVHSIFTVSTMAESDQQVQILGSKGRIQVDIPFNIPADRKTTIRIISGGDPPVAPGIETVAFDIESAYTSEAEAFAAAVLAGDPVPTPPSDGVANMKVIEAIIEAATTTREPSSSVRVPNGDTLGRI